MTRNEIRIAAAKKKADKAHAKMTRLEEGKIAAIRALSFKWAKRIWPAEKAWREANAELTTAKLAAYGIVPDHTIIIFKGKEYAVRIAHRGWDELIPVTKDGREHLGKNPVHGPYRWESVTVTNRVMKR